jgi:hypothetical protein
VIAREEPLRQLVAEVIGRVTRRVDGNEVIRPNPDLVTIPEPNVGFELGTGAMSEDRDAEACREWI